MASGAHEAMFRRCNRIERRLRDVRRGTWAEADDGDARRGHGAQLATIVPVAGLYRPNFDAILTFAVAM